MKRFIFLMPVLMFACANSEGIDPNAFPPSCTVPNGYYELSFTEHLTDTNVPKCGNVNPIETKFPIVANSNPMWNKISQSQTDDGCFQSYYERYVGTPDRIWCFGFTQTIDMYRSFEPLANGNLHGGLTLSIMCDKDLLCSSTYDINGTHY